MAKQKNTQKQKTVIVGCKLPNGLIIEVGGQSVELNGANASNIIGGHGITYNVDADFFNAWMEAYQDRDMVKNGFIFAHEEAENTEAEAQEKTDNETKLEAINPDDNANGVSTAKED